MNYDKLKKLSKILLFLYICLLAIAWVRYNPVQEDIEVKYLTIVNHIDDGSLNEYLKYVCVLLVSMIPIGVLVPFSKGHKCKNKAYCIGITIILVMEISRFVYWGGVICLDEFFIAFIGVVIGYSLHNPISKILKYGARFQWTKESKKRGWIVYILLIIGSMVVYRNIDSISSFVKEKELDVAIFRKDDLLEMKENIANFDEPSIYDVTYENLKRYQTSITYSGLDVDKELIHAEFLRVLNEHPELFWLTGGGMGTLSDNGVIKTYWYKPTIFGDINDIPSMEETLMACVDNLTSKCPEGSEYEKALWVHDILVSNIDYDVNVFYTNLTTTDTDTPYDYAYTAYGALINRRAVCAGYAKAYQLILNRMGIECGYITGNAVNDMVSGPHAWNYVRLDGNYYQVDVTWDDPLCFGYTNNEIRHDYFALTDKEMGRNHFADSGQEIPICAGAN